MKYFALTLLLISTVYCNAQDTTSMWFHIGTSVNAYHGDLEGKKKYTSSIHVGLRLNKKKKLNGNINIGGGTLNGEDRNFTFDSNQTPLPTPNRFVKTNFFYINYDLQYNIIKKKNLIAYISQGIGMIRFTPKDSEGNNLADLPETRAGQETYRQESLMLPTNIGVIYLLPNQYGVSLQTGFYNTLTDYLDNISSLGDSGNNDNILAVRFAFYAPIK
ncbi:hypothetical protein JMN32_20240 [Fulvivirga sp. 29W222]|uniref:Outer membrane protein beta-barrel domain-containing protein n=1 Tax=Fulvivirga marina TaxID=2494733 RepID=A0A937KFZ2_9BACT|nr:hypothetical protein [Fulvivirga marina]MBL6448653.1 hypothetical protein [Fulvivirga marina]